MFLEKLTPLVRKITVTNLTSAVDMGTLSKTVRFSLYIQVSGYATGVIIRTKHRWSFWFYGFSWSSKVFSWFFYGFRLAFMVFSFFLKLTIVNNGILFTKPSGPMFLRFNDHRISDDRQASVQRCDVRDVSLKSRVWWPIGRAAPMVSLLAAAHSMK